MLKLKDVNKIYYVADTKVEALKNVNLSFRKNEFVSILGPSGCGKTTLLNLIGGLDKYTSGDLYINGRSTKEFKDRDWDVYRNHRVGFIFQNYNLIPHQTILGNVELALTISGIPKEERILRAKKALDRVGLENQYNKKPNQLSGGQCQRVAIARALVNEPEILLADEPTGALDTKTSIQILELIKEIAKERLVVMVTHNPELAYQYSTRIVKLLDGNVVEDSNPYSISEEPKESQTPLSEGSLKVEKAKMSFWTAFKLSARNLFTKRARTILTCLAGSIGIIGVSMVLAVSSGVKTYIDDMQDDMLSGYPIKVQETSYNLESFLNQMTTSEKIKFLMEQEIGVNSLLAYFTEKLSGDEALITSNEITEDYINYVSSMPKEYYNAISYNYGINLNQNIYTKFKVNSSATEEEISLSTLRQMYTDTLASTEFGEYATLIAQLGTTMSQAIPNEEYILSQYDLIGGSKVATEENEIMLVVNKNKEVNDLSLALLGIYSQEDFLDLARKSPNNRKDRFTYKEILGKEFVYYPNDLIYEENEDPSIPFIYQGFSDSFEKENEGLSLKIVGILMPKEDISYGSLKSGFYYTDQLVEYARKNAQDSKISQYAREHKEDGKDFVFGETVYTENGQTIKNAIYSKYHYYDFAGNRIEGTFKPLYTSATSLTSSILNQGSNAQTTAFGPTLRELGVSDIPSSVSIYPLNFDEKALVTDYLELWNSKSDLTFTYYDNDLNQNVTVTLTQSERNQIEYSDVLEVVITMINGMIDIVTYALIAFTALSLIVSCVMISIITYVSVMERIKEIGVIRSLGGRKKDVSHLFNAETFIIGISSGVIGVVVTYIISGVLNLIIESISGVYPIATLQWYQAVGMILVSVGLTCISGLLPARSAAKKDPVVALRTE